MSDSKQPSLTFGAPPSENKAASNTFGQPSSTANNTIGNAFGATSSAPATTSASPFGTFGNASNTSGTSPFNTFANTSNQSTTSPFGTAFNQGSSTFGGQAKSSPFTLPGANRTGSNGSVFGQRSDPTPSQSSPSIFNPGTSSLSPGAGGAQSNAESGAPFQNLASSQPGNTSAGLSTPASGKSPFSFGNISTTPAGPPPSAANGPSTTTGSTFNFAKPQQPGSGVFGPKNDAQTPAVHTSTSIATSNASSDAPKSALSFGSLPSADGKPSSQSSGISFGTAGAGNRLGMLGRNEGNQKSPSLFGELSKPQENSAPATATSQSGFPASMSDPATGGQPTQPTQSDGAPKTTPSFGNLTTGAASTSSPQASTFTMSGARRSPEASQSTPPTFNFPAATSSSANPPQSAPALGSTGAKAGSFASFFKPSTTEPSGSAPVTGTPTPNLFSKLNAPAEKQAADSVSAPGTTANTSATSTAAVPASTAAGTPALGEKNPPTTSAPKSSSTAASAPAAPATSTAPSAPADGAAPTASTNVGTSTTGQPPPPQSRLKNKSMEEIITSWAKDLAEYQKEFQKQADTIASWDQMIVENGDKIQKLYASTFEAERASSEVERQLSAVVSQQDELSGWLDRYEKEVDEIFSRQVGQGEGLQGPDQERERTYKLAEKLSDRLDEMGKDLKSMIEEINSASLTLNKTNKADDPLSQIVKVLNSHLASLQWIDENTAAIQAKVSTAQKVGQGLGTNGHRGLGEDAVDDFYRSYLGRR